MKRIAKDRIYALFQKIGEKRNLLIPVKDGAGVTEFAPYSEGAKLSDELLTVRSAKDLFFPQVEDLVGFKVSGKAIKTFETRKEVKEFAVFGVRACDARSFEILDRVFLAEPEDSFYKERREKSVIITLACAEPMRTCFCTNFGIDATAPGGDVECIEAKGSYYFEPKTDKGAKLLEELSGLLEDAGSDVPEVKEEREAIRGKLDALPLGGLDFAAFGAGATKALFDRPEWEELSRSCLGCGTCTFICPTCQCYDVEEFDSGEGVKRFRCWDSCMYRDFTMMSAGQPRPTQKERFRQRFMHKLVYYPENNEGIYSCVGCGRCVRKCPINMNIVKVIKSLGKEDRSHEK